VWGLQRSTVDLDALICLARRRVDVIYAMLRDRKPYQVPGTDEPESNTAAA
jgi:hypothetical protein